MFVVDISTTEPLSSPSQGESDSRKQHDTAVFCIWISEKANWSRAIVHLRIGARVINVQAVESSRQTFHLFLLMSTQNGNVNAAFWSKQSGDQIESGSTWSYFDRVSVDQSLSFSATKLLR